MRLNLLLVMLFITACTSTQLSSKIGEVHFSEVRDLVSTQKDEIAVLEKFGSPSRRTSIEGFYTLQYDDSKSGLPRFFITLAADKKNVVDAIWIPQPTDAEYTLSGAKNAFAGSEFREVVENKKENPHAFTKGAVNYIDEKSGVTIRYDRNHKATEAIGFYRNDVRIPAQEKAAKDVPYTF